MGLCHQADAEDPHAWPNWRGPTYSGSTTDDGIDYLTDIRQAKLLWKGVTKKPLRQGESLKSRVLSDLESIKNNKDLVKSFFEAGPVAFAAA